MKVAPLLDNDSIATLKEKQQNLQASRNTPITMEQLPPPVTVTLSEEAKKRSSEMNGLHGLKLDNLPDLDNKQLAKYKFILRANVESNKIHGKSTGDVVKDLTLAYDTLYKRMESNSEDMDTYGKFLDEALRQNTNIEFQKKARDKFFKEHNITDMTGINESKRAEYDVALDAAIKAADEFSSSYLNNYKNK